MRHSLAVSLPPPEEVESWAKAAAAIVAFLAALWLPVARWRARRRTERERVRLALRAVPQLLDTVHLILRDRLPLEGEWRPSDADLLYQLALTIDRREALYLAAGHTPTLPTPKTLALSGPRVPPVSIEEVVRRTQRIHLAEERARSASLFTDEWTGDTKE
jgi:hypothetical protein